ncbi:sensor domain-containing diguanylate cyclase [Arhodomonas sp. AD133]|uniref:sensor domain-containing diguanylate cyclase n=1 Tax=Arhodomonas sp. AD133 TaxID=3415009 RepID=UPI003EBAFC82
MQRKKLYFAVALAVLLSVGFVATSAISYFVAHDSLTDQIAEQTLPLTSDNIYSEIQRDLVRSTLIASLMAHDTFVRDWTLDGEKDPRRMTRYLAAIQERYDTITAFFVSDRTRRYYHPTGVIKTVDPDDPADAWYFRVREMNAPYEINIDSDTADRTRVSIFINHRLTDDDGDYLGAIGIGLSVNAVARLIETYEERYGRQVYFVDRQGGVTLHGESFTGAERLHDRAGLGRFATRILANPSTSLSYTRPDGALVYVNSRLVPEFDWYLIVEQSETPGEARLWYTFLFNTLLALGVTVLVLTVAHFTVRGYQRGLEEMATRDRLTGAANRQVFDILFEQLVKQVRRQNGAVSVVSVDIDHFKTINDTYGHQGGDVVIRAVATVLHQSVRESDVVCRWGGEEFLVVLGECSREQAVERAEAMREAVRHKAIRFGREDIHVSISVGVTELGEQETLPTVLHRVDTALYRSKAQGRDCVNAA